ncbi:MAG: hypothetical protein L0Z55_02165 [Planctomycetes bacterium]|nr:hypothetical protein [Planctomycetota bacterium]
MTARAVWLLLALAEVGAGACGAGARGEDPTIERASPPCYALDGWEESDAALLHHWLVLAPLDRAAADAIGAPESCEKLFPQAGRAGAGRIWRRADFPGMGVRVAAAPAGTPWSIAHTFLSVEAAVEGRFRLSLSGGREARLLVNGAETARVTAGAPRAGGASVQLRGGLNRVQVEVLGPGESIFYLQLADAAGRPLPFYAQPQLNEVQRALFEKGIRLDGAILASLIDQGIADLNAPFAALGKTLASMEAELAVRESPEAGRAAERLRALRRLAGLVAMGGNPEEFAGRFREAWRRVEELESGSEPASEHETLRRMREAAGKIGRVLGDPAAEGAAWHVLSGAADFAELRHRYGLCRRLLIDIEADAMEVVQTFGASSKIRARFRMKP